MTPHQRAGSEWLTGYNVLCGNLAGKPAILLFEKEPARLIGVAGLSGVPGTLESLGRSRPGEERFPLFLTKTSTTIRGKTYTHYKIVESLRDEGRVKHRVLWSLGALTEEQAEQVRRILAVTRGTDWVSVPFTEIAVTQHAAYLDIAVGHAFWDAGEWSQFWGDDAFWVEALVLNRFVDPQAKIHLHAWVASTALPAYYEVNPRGLDPYAVYRIFDRMAKREGDVQQWIAAHVLTASSQDAPTFFYDLTSTYVDGTTSPLAKPGYSRDHRSDRTQIVIGLLITATGDPVYWQVWPGNTPDVTAVQTVVTDLQTRLKLGPCILVFDRGMVSAANLAAIKAAHHTYLSAVDRDALAHVPGWSAWPETIPADHWQLVLAQRGFTAYDADVNRWYREWAEPGHRWVVAFDYQRGCLEKAVQARAIAAVESWVRQHHRNESPETVLRALASSQMNRLRIQSTGQTRITLTELAPVQRLYLAELECEQVVAPSAVQSVIQAMQSWL